MKIDMVLRPMQIDDIPACQRLRAQAGWNQTDADWQRFISYNPQGCFVTEADGMIVGSACTIAYEHFGWVAMVLVDEGYRRQGIGKRLLNTGIQHLVSRGLTVKLDATPAGKLLYDTLGFLDEYGAARYECNADNFDFSEDANGKPITKQDLDRVDEFDREFFGNSRRQVLLSYLEYYPRYCYLFEESGEIEGYVMAREGTNAFHIGPWVCRETEIAKLLFLTCIQQKQPERVFVDIVEPNPHVVNLLTSLGFKQQRPFIRMFLGKNTHPGRPEHVYGMSGPELG